MECPNSVDSNTAFDVSMMLEECDLLCYTNGNNSME
jgi:hypothetical protein